MYAHDVAELTDIGILQPEVFAHLLDLESEVEKVELETLLMNRAKELKVLGAFKKKLIAYRKDDKRINKPVSSFDCGFYLTRTDKGAVANRTENYLSILRNDINYANKILFNELTGAPERVKNDGSKVRWSDVDDAELRCYIEKTYGIHNEKKLNDAFNIIIHENSYNPVKEIIESITWDGVPRIRTMLHKWLKVEDDAYTREVSRLIFAGGINRLYEPGCKYDDMAVLIGKNQGEGKSTFVSWLAIKEEFFREVKEIEGQKGVESLEGGWICEMGELLALTKAKEVEAVKAYITCRVDTYRKPFARRVTDQKRQSIFIGTTNREEFLTDKTGNRRFYPVVCNSTGYELFKHEKEVKADILQCWAEAKHLYDLGKLPAYADDSLLDEIRARQEKAVEDDYREGMIEAYLDKTEIKMVCILEIWQKALGNEYSKPSRKDSNDIATMLNKQKEWVKAEKPTRFAAYGLQKYWSKVTNE